MYMGYPLGYILCMFVRGTYVRHFYSIIMGFILQVFMFRE